jgi:hypothetical protein
MSSRTVTKLSKVARKGRRGAFVAAGPAHDKGPDFGRQIFVYNHLQTNQVVYSLTQNLNVRPFISIDLFAPILEVTVRPWSFLCIHSSGSLQKILQLLVLIHQHRINSPSNSYLIMERKLSPVFYEKIYGHLSPPSNFPLRLLKLLPTGSPLSTNYANIAYYTKRNGQKA